MKNYIIVIIVLLALGAGAFVLLRPTDKTNTPTQTADTNQTGDSNTTQPSDDESDEPALEAITITYTDQGFDAETYEVAVGGTITIVNNASSDLEFSSDNHPTHTKNPELNTATLSSGQSTQITVEQAGSWGVHDHLNSQNTAILIVR